MSNNILMIDDAGSVRSRIIGTLKKVDLFEHYREARNVIDGSKSLIASKHDVVICDLEMPRMDGFKFLLMVNSRWGLKDICSP
jgi:two-component system, cell cycle response regulator